MTAHPLLRPLAAAFVALALLTVGLTGCGGDDDDGDRSGSSSGSESDGLDPAVGGADDPGAGDLGQVAVELTEVAQLDRPTVLTARAGTTDLYVGERAGQVRVLSVAADGSVEAAGDPLLDISDDVSLDGEQGLLGLAFSADGATMNVIYNN